MLNKKYFLLEPSRFRLDGGAMYGIIPRPLWSKHSPPDEQNRIDLALRLLLITSKDRVALIDTGIGDYHDEKFQKMFDVRTQDCPLEKALHQIGLKAEDVTDLVLSHLHFDHIGGISKVENGSLQPVFKNATCYVHQKHFEYSNKPTLRDSGSFRSHEFQPVLDYYKANNKMVWLNEEDQGELIPSLELNYKVSFGHTPWMIHPFDGHFLYLADLIPTSHHIHIPWVMGYDIAPGQTTEFKQSFLDFIHQRELTVIFEHDPDYWGAKIERDVKGRCRPKELYKTQDAKRSLSYEINF